jgi:peptidyl-tRNA hydrolase, PTH1 family
MKLLVGLGNPGSQYTKTRHNAGFMVIDRLVERHAAGEIPKSRFNAVAVEAMVGPKGSATEKCLLLKPTTYMNRSGQSVQEAAAFYKLNPAFEVLIIVDDLYLPVGAIRLRPGGGAGGHNGLIDVERALGSDNYARLRVGVGLRPTGGMPPMMNQADFVLSRFMDEESADLETSVARAADAAEVFATKGMAAAMNKFNAVEKDSNRGKQAS